MDNGLGLHPSRISATKGWHIAGTAVGLGNHCSIRLSYGANGRFPRFPPMKGQLESTQTRKVGRNMATQEVAHGVRDAFQRCSAKIDATLNQGVPGDVNQ
jgi:hypothetical protein